MSAIDELCRMLDERGVEYEGGERSLRWRDRYGIMMQAFPLANGELGMGVWSCTPEQAIAATLGAGTCHLIDTQFPTGDDSYFKTCSGCGFWIYNRYNWEKTRFCPHCGRKVVDA